MIPSVVYILCGYYVGDTCDSSMTSGYTSIPLNEYFSAFGSLGYLKATNCYNAGFYADAACKEEVTFDDDDGDDDDTYEECYTGADGKKV